jgi:glycosyltransferase involved in cell wall biosynthesis
LRLTILIPVFNDWQAVERLLPRLDEAMAGGLHQVDVLLVDDGSLEPLASALTVPRLEHIGRLAVLELKRNLGHQRAIAVGLAYVQDQYAAREECDAVVVMDGDGEDDPADIPRLLEEAHRQSWRPIVFAARARRSESWLFQACYRIYQVLHWLLTGYRVRVGNFSVVPAKALERVVVVSELWNHYSAAVFNARIAYTTLPTTRGRRLAGRTRMNFTSLVVHGLSALSVYSHIIGVRLLLALLLFGCLLAGGVAAVLRTHLGVAGQASLWPLVLIALVLILLLQTAVSGVVFVFLVLSGRQTATFLPLRDYRWFVGREITLATNSADEKTAASTPG